jgi:hypothetical protein
MHAWMTDCPRHPEAAEGWLGSTHWGQLRVGWCMILLRRSYELRRIDETRKTYREKEATCIDIEHMRIWTHENMNRWSTFNNQGYSNLLYTATKWPLKTIQNPGFSSKCSPAPKLRTPKRSAGRGVVGTGYILYGHYRNTSLYRMFDCIKCICIITCMIHKLQKHNQ